MGYHTSPVTAFLLTVFNVRLGWWFPNPVAAGSGSMSPHFSLSYLVAELFGGASDKSSFVMVSDGGHFENLAAYELIRRRCRVVIISDAECDDKYTFGGLGTLIRMCQVDFEGCRIHIDVDDIRPQRGSDGTGWSKSRWTVGRIDYNDGGPPGILVYVKASMTGKEDTSVRQYKSSRPQFPHESTGDQFYGEDQFESYRRLAHHIAATVFRGIEHDAHARRQDVGNGRTHVSPIVPAECSYAASGSRESSRSSRRRRSRSPISECSRRGSGSRRRTFTESSVQRHP
jgi:hypothetical protein